MDANGEKKVNFRDIIDGMVVSSSVSPVKVRENVEPPILTKRTPKGGQVEAIKALYSALIDPPPGQRPVFVLSGKEGEGIGVGKTHISISTAFAYLNHKRGTPRGRVLVLVPPHLTVKWRDEVEKDGGIPVLLKRPEALLELLAEEPKGVEFVIVSRDTAKRVPRISPVRLPKRLGLPACPECGNHVAQRDKPERCPFCGSPLFQEEGGGVWGKVLAKRARAFDLLLLDEGHAFRNETLQGALGRKLMNRLPTIVISGTIMGGMATDLLFVLQAAYPHMNALKRAEFVEKYGSFLEEERRVLGRHRIQRSRREAPGFSPALWPLVLGMSVFIGLRDVADLPPVREKVVVLPSSEAQRRFIGALKELANLNPHHRNRRSLAILGAASFYGVDLPGVEGIRLDGNRPPEPLPPIPFSDLLPKEVALLVLAQYYCARNEKLIVFVEGSGVWDVQGRLYEVLTDGGFRPFILTADIPPEKRYELLRGGKSPEILITNPRLVETGLDLIDYRAAVFFQPPRSPFTLRQAAGRIRRIGQEKEAHLYYFAYEGVQEGILLWVAERMRQALIFEGALGQNGAELLGILPEDPMEVAARYLLEKEEKGRVGAVRGFFLEDSHSPLSPSSTSEPIVLPTLKEERVVRVGRTKIVLPKGQPILFPIEAKEVDRG